MRCGNHMIAERAEGSIRVLETRGLYPSGAAWRWVPSRAIVAYAAAIFTTFSLLGCASLSPPDKKGRHSPQTADAATNDPDASAASKSDESWWHKLGNLRDPNSAGVKRERNQKEISKHFNSNRDAAELKVAVTRYEEGNPIGATEVLLPLLKRNPDNREARLLLAEAYIAQNKPDDARKQVDYVLQKDPDDSHAQYTMGLVHDAAGNSQKAAEHYGRAMQLEPDSEVYAVSYETATRQTGRDIQGEPKLLSSDAKRSAEKPLSSRSADRNGSSVQAENDDRDAANERLAAAETALRASDLNAACREMQEAGKLAPHDPQISISAAVCALRYNHTELAVRILTTGVKRFPRSAAMYRTLGTAYYRRKEYAEAQTALQQAASLDNSCALSYFLLGCTLTKLGQSDAAETQFRLAQALDPRYAAPH